MKNSKPHFIIFLVTFLVASLGLTSCVVHEHHPHRHRTVIVKEKRIPPGQAKKRHGDRSARDHAPGHRKKDKIIIIE
ncbi:hypothetical protein [Flavobacterium humi]|uniref:Quinol oxidase subunit 4 n=1 Tax=Flavobacterium humi TaxID=2562683 RepID=A0A4Z0L875_9FLAO|nr:hypothetical protein [Flavobacterium humi]TGD58510.1 hypothetical protein E4635_06245 [Flavobacterium humi]